MRLNRLEFLAMNNGPRRLHMRLVEFRIFKNLLRRKNICLHGKILLDAACGSGYSLKLLEKAFQPERLFGFDIMPEQAKLVDRPAKNTYFFLGDITRLALADAIFDGIFAFGILHHIDDWIAGAQELHRVLKPGGVLLIEEPNRPAVEFFHRYFRFDFPKKNRFDWPDFELKMAQIGFKKLHHTKIYCDCLRAYLWRKI
ncbi:MAG: class I SAM-dependent methyltransferase [Calditrichaeota bacterium]|nr:MAG: class I SAM-dependent methyltransferase [Calditrichota bacterium]